MKVSKKISCLIFLMLYSLASWGSSASPPVTVCIDPEPPPWAYWIRDKSGEPTKELTGVSVELIRETFARIGKEVKFIGDLPWARCMMMVEYRQIDFAMDAYFDLERSKRFDYSVHYRTSTPQVFFRRESPITVTDVADLKKLKGCGLVGWSYVHYGLSKETLDMGVGLANMVSKLKARRCDFFVEELETIYSNKLVGDDYLTDPAIAHSPVPWAKAPTSHLMASKNSEASKLLPAIDRALAGLIKSGTAAVIWKKHARELPFRP